MFGRFQNITGTVEIFDFINYSNHEAYQYLKSEADHVNKQGRSSFIRTLGHMGHIRHWNKITLPPNT